MNCIPPYGGKLTEGVLKDDLFKERFYDSFDKQITLSNDVSFQHDAG